MRDYFMLAVEELCPGLCWIGYINNRIDFETKCYKINNKGEPDYNANNFGATWEQIDARMKEIEAAEPMKCLREERDKKLAETDWWAMSDRTMTTEQTNYRQALRDIPANIEAGNLNAPTMNMNKRFADDTNIVFDWPTKPE